MTLKSFLKNIAPNGIIKLWNWFIPYISVCKHFYLPRVENGEGLFGRYRILKRNRQYKNLHKGQRCFIVGNAPSINKLDMSLLVGEISFSVSNGYHHPLYSTYQPKYHCLPPVCYNSLVTEKVVVDWFKEMHEKIENAELFLSTNEYPLICKYNLFPDRCVNYVALMKDIATGKLNIELEGLAYAVQSVPIMALQIALYMGFREIYLIGCDHNSIQTGHYHYFYEPTVLKNLDVSVTHDGKTEFSAELESTYVLFQQYKQIKKLADSMACRIFNASPEGVLDVVERIPFQDIWK